MAVSISLFLGAVDGSIVNIALPTLMEAFDADFPTIQWVSLAFLLGLNLLLLSAGRFADMVGKKTVFVTGLLIFLAGSALCGFSPGVYWLIAFRFVQSIGAALIVALGIAIITETWPTRQRGKAIGIAGGIISFGIVAGPTMGGLILQALNWHWIFYVNLPFGALALTLVLLFVPPLKPDHLGEKFDFAGALLVGLCMLAFSLALTLGQNLGFSTLPILGLFVLSAACLPAFVWVERRARYPMLDFRLFNHAPFSLGLLTGIFTFICISGVVFLLPFYLSLVMGLSQRDAGLLMSVVPTVLAVVSPISGSLSDRFGTRAVSLAGLALILAGYLAMTTLAVDSQPVGFVLRMLPVGLGMATFQSPNNSAIMGAAPPRRLGVASGTLSMTRNLGQTTGVALLGAFFASRLASHAGQAVNLDRADAIWIVSALHDQFLLVSGLTAFALFVAFWGQFRSASQNKFRQEEQDGHSNAEQKSKD